MHGTPALLTLLLIASLASGCAEHQPTTFEADEASPPPGEPIRTSIPTEPSPQGSTEAAAGKPTRQTVYETSFAFAGTVTFTDTFEAPVGTTELRLDDVGTLWFDCDGVARMTITGPSGEAEAGNWQCVGPGGSCSGCFASMRAVPGKYSMTLVLAGTFNVSLVIDAEIEPSGAANDLNPEGESEAESMRKPVYEASFVFVGTGTFSDTFEAPAGTRELHFDLAGLHLDCRGVGHISITGPSGESNSGNWECVVPGGSCIGCVGNPIRATPGQYAISLVLAGTFNVAMGIEAETES